MRLVQSALRRPLSVLVAIIAVIIGGGIALGQMARDVFPPLGVPTIYVAQPYGGMDPSQMEGFLTYYYEYHFLYITGIEHVESKSIQGAAIIKLQFYPGTDMSQAMSETVSYVNRARAFMPPGAVPPFVTRFDAGSVPVGYLAFSSTTRTVGQIQDLALNTIRPLFATLPGVSAPPPFGSGPRSIVVSLNPERLQAYDISAQDVVTAIANAETISPSGNIEIGGLYPIVPVNSIVRNVKDLQNVAIKPGIFPGVFVRDVATVSDASDIPTSIALVNGRPTVYIPVTKRADASTISVVNLVKANMAKFQAALPDDVQISYVFDQSPFVTGAISGLTLEGLLGALLAGIMVLLFLRDWRSALIVVLNIPVSLLAAVLALWLAGQTVNLMTLGGLALAVGILVDMSTVAIENIHTHVAKGKLIAPAVADAGREVALPLLIAMLCVVAVFLPSFGMEGAARALFVPLSLAVGFSMAASWLLANTFVPILAVWIHRSAAPPSPLEREGGAPLNAASAAGLTRPSSSVASAARIEAFAETRGAEPGFFRTLQIFYGVLLNRLIQARWLVGASYLAATALLIVVLLPRIGTDIFPRAEAGQLQLRIRAPAGTLLERTETYTQNVLKLIEAEAGNNNVGASLALIGVHGSAYPINFIYLWNSGPQESVLQVELKSGAGDIGMLKERLRQHIARDMRELQVSFEPADIVSRVMSFGASTPIEVAVSGPNLENDRAFAERVRQKLSGLPVLRDVQFGQPLDYPAVNVALDRERAGVLGITANDLTRALSPATSSSRFTQPLYWAAPNTGIAYQVQVEIPQQEMTSIEDVKGIPITAENGKSTLLRNVATVQAGAMVGEYDRYNMDRMVTVTANIANTDLGSAAKQVEAALAQLGKPPARVSIASRGQVQPLTALVSALQTGLLLATLVIFLLLAANFQSVQLALVAILTTPAAVAGAMLALWFWNSTLNLESFMGVIMAVGVAVANAILLVTFAERSRIAGKSSRDAAREGAESRLRPILMTTFAMIAGMLPMAIGFGATEGQAAPLGQAVIGGLAGATAATLFVLPGAFALVRARAGRQSPSLDPDDPASKFARGGAQ